MRSYRYALTMLVVLFHAAAASAQTPNDRFEVASIRASRIEVMRITPENGIVGGPELTITGARVNVSKLSLSELVTRAYDIRPYQLFGPEWLRQLRFDIQATLPEGTNPNSVPDMLRSLLEERFGMVAHREQRELPVYELVVRQEGSRLGPVVETDVAIPPSLTAPDGITPLHPSLARWSTYLRATAETDGFLRVEGIVSLDELTQLLTFRMDLPVLNRTGLTGYYRVAMRLLPNDYQSTARSDAGADPVGSSWFKALERLGLELKRTRAELPIVIMDKIERTPTEN